MSSIFASAAVRACLFKIFAKPLFVSQNERIAQLVTITTGSITFEKVEKLDISDRSSGGFGSTGKN